MSTKQVEGLRPLFWELPLIELSVNEWEALCDGCGRCCLKKFTDDEDEKDVIWTRVVCQYFDESSNQCSCYSERSKKVPDCVDVKSLDLLSTHWIPNTCAYKLRAQGRPLFAWHPLLTGSAKAITDADISIADKVVSEEYVHPEGYHEHVIRWVEST